MDELSAGGWGRPGSLHLVPAPHGGRARGGHAVDHQRSPGRGVGKVPLAGRGGQGAVARVHGGEGPQSQVAVHGEAVWLDIGAVRIG